MRLTIVTCRKGKTTRKSVFLGVTLTIPQPAIDLKYFLPLRNHLTSFCIFLQQCSSVQHQTEATEEDPNALRRKTGVDHAWQEQAHCPPQGQAENQAQEALEPGNLGMSLHPNGGKLYWNNGLK